jgi:hypothetical protein
MKKLIYSVMIVTMAASVAAAKTGDKGTTPPKSTSVSKGSTPMTSPKSHTPEKSTHIDKGPKLESLHGNKKVGSLPGYKSDLKQHEYYCSKYNVPSHLHNQCYFHHDFCWDHYCYLPRYGCCGYWHPYARCWYYWYQPYCCYLPYSCIETYAPSTTPVVNVNTNTNTNINTPALPPGASAVLPAGVNPIIPAPKQ